MLDLEPEFAAAVEKRLREDEIVWFTTVSPGGHPVPNPVWFYWDGEDILVYSQPSSFRVRNIKQNPNVALHLQGVDGAGSNVVIISGTAVLETGKHTIPQGYWDKYSKYLSEIDTTEEGMTRDYSVQIRVRPRRVRGE